MTNGVQHLLWLFASLWLEFYSLNSVFQWVEDINVDEDQPINVFFYGLCFGCHTKKSVPKSRSQRFLPLFPSLYVLEIHSQRNGKMCVCLRGFGFCFAKSFLLALSPTPLSPLKNAFFLLWQYIIWREQEYCHFVYFVRGNLGGIWIAQYLNTLSVWKKFWYLEVKEGQLDYFLIPWQPAL